MIFRPRHRLVLFLFSPLVVACAAQTLYWNFRGRGPYRWVPKPNKSGRHTLRFNVQGLFHRSNHRVAIHAIMGTGRRCHLQGIALRSTGTRPKRGSWQRFSRPCGDLGVSGAREIPFRVPVAAPVRRSWTLIQNCGEPQWRKPFALRNHRRCGIRDASGIAYASPRPAVYALDR
jgi:hypothetical protein